MVFLKGIQELKKGKNLVWKKQGKLLHGQRDNIFLLNKETFFLGGMFFISIKYSQFFDKIITNEYN